MNVQESVGVAKAQDMLVILIKEGRKMFANAYLAKESVNNAAIVTLRGTTYYSLEDFSSMMSSNVESPYHLCQLVHPLLKASGHGSIIFVSSIAGVIALPKLSGYAATKGAIIQISKNLACEWAKDNIRTNTVAPWAVNIGAAAVEPCMQLWKAWLSSLRRR